MFRDWIPNTFEPKFEFRNKCLGQKDVLRFQFSIANDVVLSIYLFGKGFRFSLWWHNPCKVKGWEKEIRGGK